MSQWLELREADQAACGGKARGLARLIAAGMSVPAGVVLVGAQPGDPLASLDAWLQRLGPGPYAVRSSADVEDGEQASYAGQFESVLGLVSAAEVRAAIERCLASAESARVDAYRDAIEPAGAGVGMAVIIQRQVDARCAGVLFTLDPLTGARERWTIEAVAGLGEALVAGHQRPDRHVLDPADPVASCVSEPAGDAPVLSADELAMLVEQATRARAHIDRGELDMEWAIERAGGQASTLQWLQARPITRTGALALDELDTPLVEPAHGFTRYNIGEILPGVVTPMTACTSVELVDGGMRRYYQRLGVVPRGEPLRCLVMVSGHAFLNMYAPYSFASALAGASKDEADRSLGGRVFDELDGLPTRGRVRRVLTALRCLPVLKGAAQEVERVEQAVAAMPARTHADALDELDAWLQLGLDASEAHLNASTWAGMLAGALERMLGKDAPLDDAGRRLFAELLAGIGDVESADIGVELAALIELARAEPQAREQLASSSDDDALAWLRGPSSGAVGQAFAALLTRHGHRCFREFELRERSWAEHPAPLLAAVRAGLAAPPRARRATASIDELSLPPGSERGVRWIVPRVHAGIRLRERSKSLFVRVARMIGRCVAAIGEQLVARGQLAELDLVYFVTLDELREAFGHARVSLTARARARRRMHDRQALLRFAMVYRDKPTPLPPAAVAGDATRLRGCAVSPGVIEGRARVARTIAEAQGMAVGEILIVPFTDVGWTPFFGLAAGLVTEVGGTLSHGAVIARELGLPTIVDVPGATEQLRTGQRVRLDADVGELIVLE